MLWRDPSKTRVTSSNIPQLNIPGRSEDMPLPIGFQGSVFGKRAHCRVSRTRQYIWGRQARACGSSLTPQPGAYTKRSIHQETLMRTIGEFAERSQYGLPVLSSVSRKRSVNA